jgi:Tudor domain/MYND finger
VEYGTQSEADEAIRYINANGHLQIWAQYSKNKNRNNDNKFNRSNDHRPVVKNAAAIMMEDLPIQEPAARVSDRRSNGHEMGEAINVVVGPCTRCGRASETQCEVCLDPYCSPSCQRLDWPAHKKICRPMPALVPAIRGPALANLPRPVEKVVPFLPLPTPESPLITGVPASIRQLAAVNRPAYAPAPVPKPTMAPVAVPKPTPAPVVVPKPMPAPVAVRKPTPKAENVPLHKEIELITQRIKSTIVKDQPEFAPFPPSGGKVVITAAPSAGVLYVRGIDPTNDLCFRQLLQEVCSYAATAPFLTVKPTRGDYVLAPFEGTYYRANVLLPNAGCTEETVKVAYIDFGNMAVVEWSQCKTIDSQNLIGRTRYNFRVYLLNVDYTKHTNDATVRLINQCVDENVEFEVHYEGELPAKEKKEVTLIRVSDNMSLNAKIKELATFVAPHSDVFAYSVSRLKS